MPRVEMSGQHIANPLTQGILSLIMRPHPQHLNHPTFWDDLVHQPVLYVDTPRARTGQIAD